MDLDEAMDAPVNAALAAASTTANDNPEDGARALDLSGASGVPPLAVYNDLQEFQKDYKSKLASSIVGGNKELTDFVNSHPLAPVVANDDYGNLDTFARGASFTSKVLDVLRGPVDPQDMTGREAFQAGFGPEPLGQIAKSDPFFKGHPVVADMVSKGLLPFELANRTLQGALTMLIEGGGQLGEHVVRGVGGGPEAQQYAGGLVREVMEYELVNGGGIAEHIPEGTAMQGQIIRVNEARRAARQWIEAGVEPPTGVHPLIDESKTRMNSALLQGLNQDLNNALKSAMRERSADSFQRLGDILYRDAEIGISGDSVAALYADRQPAPDDGLLGWVPGIENKLEMARDGGVDVNIPIKDWLTRVDPKLAATLNDDIRMYPGGITNREAGVGAAQGIIADTVEAATGAKVEPTYPTLIDAPLPAVRGAASVEPLFSVGDRKLQLQKLASAQDRAAMNLAAGQGLDWNTLAPEEQRRLMAVAGDTLPEWSKGLHDFQLLDQNGNVVGTLNLSEQRGGKQVYVDMISGVNGFGVRDFGPSLIRDLYRQIKTEFPNAEEIVGDRVSGARERFGTEGLTRVKLAEAPYGWDVAGGVDDFRKILEGGEWKAYHPTVEGYAKAKFDPQTQAINNAVRDEFLKRVPHGTDIEFVQRLRAARTGGEVRGAFLPGRGVNNLLLFATDVEDHMGVMHHEAIHALRDLITPAEWETLAHQSRLNDWQKQFDIARWDRHGLSNSQKLEESVAEAYRYWEAGRGEVGSQLHPIFQKIKEFLDAIRKRINDVLGRPGTVDDIFERIRSGEVGARAGAGVEAEPRFSVGEEGERPSYQDLLDRVRANATGLDAKSYANLQKLYHQRYAEDLAAATARAEKQQAREQTATWKKEYSEVRSQTELRLRQRPDIAADLFFSLGDLYGRKLDKQVRIASADLTEAQRDALPSNYYAKGGLPLDSLSTMFGFHSGDAMVSALAQLKQTGESAVERLARLTKEQTDAEMAGRHGDLQANILAEAKDQALAEVDENILAQEMYAVAALAGQQPLDIALMRQGAKEQVGRLTVGSISSDRFRDRMAKHGRDAVRALLNGDPGSALVSLQNKTFNGLYALEAKKLETEMARFEKIAKKYRKVVVENVDPEYVNYVHQILDRIGRPSRRDMASLVKDIEGRGTGSLEDFVSWKAQMMRVIHVAPELMDPTWTPKDGEFGNLTNNQFTDISKMIRTLDFNGRDELKLVRAGEKMDFGPLKAQMLEALQNFAARQTDIEGRPIGTGKGKALARRYLASHLQLETIFNRFDHYDSQGVWNQYVMRDLIDGANQIDAWKKEYAKKLLDLDDGVDTRKLIQNDIFRDPAGGPPFVMNRGQLRTAMLNVGTRSNLEKLAYGYRLSPKQVMDWIHRNATKQDWDFVQGVWDNIFKDIKVKIDTMYRSLTGGVAPEDVPAVPIDTPFGRYEGGYYPIIYHREFEGTSKKLMGRDPLEQSNYFSAMTPSGHTITRTGYVAPLSLNLDFMPGRIGQMLHDIGLRPAVINASKVFYDKTIREAVRVHVGSEYRDLMIPYLQGVANSANYMTRAAREFTDWSELIRQNMITTLIGLNPGTIGKHFFTAMYQSAQEVGVGNFLKAVRDMFTRNDATSDSMWRFARDNSLELQRRDRNWFETLGGATEQLVPKKGWDTWRNKVIMAASKPVALSDMLSAVPTWIAQYQKAMDEGMSHGDSVSLADRSVRRAHGSTAITNRPEIMRIGNPWFTSVYNFFNHIMNRQAEMVWQAGETGGLWKEGEKVSALANVPKLTSQLFAYVLFPAMVEYAFNSSSHKQDESPLATAAKSLALDVSASWIGIRDAANLFLMGGEPSVGLVSTAMREMGDVWRDMRKSDPLGREHAGLFLQHAAGLIGVGTGMMPQQVGRTARGLYDVNTGRARPRTPLDWWSQLRYGTMEGHTR